MKKALVERTAPPKTRKMDWWIVVQTAEPIVILNIFKNRILKARHCVNRETMEFATYDADYKCWEKSKIETAIEAKEKGGENYYYYGERRETMDERCNMSDKDRGLLQDLLDTCPPYIRGSGDNVLMQLGRAETDYDRTAREKKETRRIEKVNRIMAKIPPHPHRIREWIDRTVNGSRDYILKGRESGFWCTNCGKEITESRIKTECGRLPKDRETVRCPECKKEVTVEKRRKTINIPAYFTVIQPVDEEFSVCRHYKAEIYCAPEQKKCVDFGEEIRLVIFKGKNRKQSYEIFYEQYYEPSRHGTFDSRSNPANKRQHIGLLYDGGIEEALEGTAYSQWARIFKEFAAAGVKANYNSLLAAKDGRTADLIEMLYRNRFHRLLTESSDRVSFYSETYAGILNTQGGTMEEIFELDKQAINRLRDRNGGEKDLIWLRTAKKNGLKLPDRVLDWLTSHGLYSYDLAKITEYMTLEQAMNYIERQKRESYAGYTIKAVIAQYEDYIRMCGKTKKDLTDEMVYRPRELKRRHDECVEEIERQQAQIRADEYSEKYGEAEAVLKEVRAKFEYAGEDFLIRVPERIVEIVTEGNRLHHCAGATDRYFDRIKQNETYICFLRRVEEPEEPFYTIEVEPGGTIRQHRGMYDEEPELERVKPFLQEWQREIRKRMSKLDHELAAASKIKREENIADLKAKNNTRVLNGLMEDFMEAIG